MQYDNHITDCMIRDSLRMNEGLTNLTDIQNLIWFSHKVKLEQPFIYARLWDMIRKGKVAYIITSDMRNMYKLAY